jgi:hypothetical protein
MKGSTRIPVVLCTQLLLASACASMHEKFIQSLNTVVSNKETVEREGFNPAYPNGFYFADLRYLTGKEQRQDGMWVYHFARPMLTGRIVCHYHLLIDQTSRLVVGYGFDSELGDPEKTCRIAA